MIEKRERKEDREGEVMREKEKEWERMHDREWEVMRVREVGKERERESRKETNAEKEIEKFDRKKGREKKWEEGRKMTKFISDRLLVITLYHVSDDFKIVKIR